MEFLSLFAALSLLVAGTYAVRHHLLAVNHEAVKAELAKLEQEVKDSFDRADLKVLAVVQHLKALL